MKLTNHEWLHAGKWMGLFLIVVLLFGTGMSGMSFAQAVSTTTVQGTVYLANGQPGSGTLVLSWPSFTTASGQLVVAGSTTVTIAPDGFVSVNLAPNQGATPTGLYYTAVYYLSDGSSNTQYWVVPAAAKAVLGQVQAQLMPATQAVQAASKSYVDQAVASLAGGTLSLSGTTMTGPLILCCDPTQPMEAADKHYVDEQAALAVPLSGAALSGPLTSVKLGGLYQVDQFPGGDFGAQLSACLSGLSTSNGGVCDARNFSGTLSMGTNLMITTANASILLPCATISTSNQIIVTAGTRNVSLHGCSLRGASTASGSQGGTVFLYSGSGAMVQVGDSTYAADTSGFHLDNAVINTTTATSATAQGFVAYRTQELDLESLYFLGNSNQTGITLDGTGNYTGGTFFDNEISGFQTAVNAIGHQTANPATTDWMNASAFTRLHIDCPTSGGNPIAGTYGINLQQGDGNTFTGGDIEGCSTALHLGANAQNNTIVGMRNENSTSQVVADAGSSYNSWMTGGTMFTGELIDNGTRNSFLDTFHRSFNGLNGDWYGSQTDATVTNHYRLGIGTGNERGLLNRYQTDYGYRWTMGLSDATSGEQYYQILDELNNVYRLSIGQYNYGQSSTNDQTVINSAGTGAVVVNGSTNAGTGGLVIGSGGGTESTVATISNAGNAQFNGTLQVGGVSTFSGSTTVKNQADAEIDATLWAGLTAAQNESFIYKNYLGASQWYMENHTTNDWSLTSAVGGLDSFKAYQSSNSGDTYVNASNSSGVVRINYEPGAGTQFKVYGGNGSSSLYASFTGTTSIQFPGLAASSGHSCLQIDNSGYVTNTGLACGTGSGGTSGTVSSGNTGQIAYYNTTGTTVSGISAVPISAGGTGSTTATGALGSLGGASLSGAAFTGAVSTTSTFSAANNLSIGPRFDVTNPAFGAAGNGATDDTAAIQAAFNACASYVSSTGTLTGNYGGIVEFPGQHTYLISSTINAYDGCHIEGVVGSSSGAFSAPRIAWNGTTAGAIYTITGFTAAANTAPLYTLASPAPHPQANLATFTVSGGSTPSVGQWVDIEGLSTSAGINLNRLIAQVAATSGNTFTVAFQSAISAGTFSDTGTATTVDVMIAFDANARYESSISNIDLVDNSISSNSYQVGFYFGSRVDTGTHVEHTDVNGATMYSYYFSNGGINVDFDKGWRSDGAGIAGIYWRVTSSDSFGIANGTTDNSRSAYSSTVSGSAVMLDNAACIANANIHFTSRNIKHEINTNITSGLGVYTLLDCPSNSNGEQFFLDFENVWMAPGSVTISPGIVMSPANDTALSLSIVNGSISGGGMGGKWVGLPSVARNDMSGVNGVISVFDYTPPFKSDGGGSTAYTNGSAPTQFLNDVNVNQLYQYGIGASAFLYTDTAFAALPNATTLYAGQIVAPPSYWSGANGSRYAIDVVYQTGTTGTPNTGATTCTGTSGASVLTCNSATDLSGGQRITIGTDSNKSIKYVDATKPNAVLVYLVSNLASTYSTATALTFSAPVLGPELQMPTKSSSAPSTLAWSRGDLEENSGASANGVAAWVNVASGTPGTWAGIPLGNSSGQISSAQISNLAFQSLTTTGTSGAATLSGGVLNIPQYAGGGSMTWPSTAGIAVYAGSSAWGTSLTAPASAIVGISDTQTLTNKSINASEVNSGTLPHAQLPALLSGDIPNNAANTTGTAAGFTGSLAGDVTGTQAATVVGKINGGSIPASANALSSNSSSQLVASTSHNLSVPANCSAASGSGTAYTCSTSPTFTPAAGDHIQFKADVANTGSATLAVNGATAATIKKWGGSGNLIANDLLSGHWISATFDGSYWQLEGQLGNANATELNGTSITGLSGSGSTLALTNSPVFTGSLTTPLTTAGVVTTTSGGVLSSVATTGTGSAVLATSPTVNGLTDNGTENLTTLNVSGTSTLSNVVLNGTCTGTGCAQTGTPAWLMYLGNGADGSYEFSSTASCTTGPTHCVINCTSTSPCALTGGEYYATQWQVDTGAYVYENVGSSPGLVIHSQGACNDYGTILINGARSTYPNTNKGVGGGSSGGSGGGTAAGTAGVVSEPSSTGSGLGQISGGAAGAASGGNGGNGASFATMYQRAFTNANAGGLDGLNLTGSAGEQGANSGGALGEPGGGMVQVCGSFNGTGGFIDASGAYGMPPSANSTGAGSGGGGGVVMLSSQATATAWPTISVAGGPGGLVTVPEALATSGSCTTQPKVTLGVTSGALNGTCTVIQAGAGCGTGTNVKFNVVGGGGTLGTGTVNPTWSGGALASCTTTAGTSSGYTAATYTTAGTGGDGGAGWYTEFQGW
jgi:hypothetical protein